MLGDVARAIGGPISRVLDRVPFEDATIEARLDLPAGFLAAARRDPLAVDRGPGERLGRFLLPYVVEGITDAEDVAEWTDDSAIVTPRYAGDTGLRLAVRCPSCRGLYVLGTLKPIVLIETDVLDVARVPLWLAFIPGAPVTCPSAAHRRCTASARYWTPRAIRVHPSYSALEALP